MYRVWGHALEGFVVWTFHSQVVERLFWVPLLGYFRFGFVRSFFFYLVASAAVLYHCNIIWDMTVSYGSCSVWMYCLRIHMNGLRETIWKVQSCSVTGLHFFFLQITFTIAIFIFYFYGDAWNIDKVSVIWMRAIYVLGGGVLGWLSSLLLSSSFW